MTTTDRFRAQCRLLRMATLVVFAGLTVLLAFGFIGLPWGHLAGVPEGLNRSRVLMTLAQVMPALGYVFALWAVQRALGDLAAGRLFDQTVPRAMRQIGMGVLIGALLNVFVVTNLVRLIIGGRGSYLYFDLSGIVLGVVGAALVMLARVVDQARELQAELDEIP